MKRIFNGSYILKRILFILILFFSLHHNSFSYSKYKIITPSGKQAVISTLTLSNNDYAQFTQLSGILFPHCIYNENEGEIEFKDIRIKAAPGSFFILYQDSLIQNVAQMTLPAIYINNQIYVPILPFINSLKFLTLFHAEIKNDKIILHAVTYKDFENTTSISLYENPDSASKNQHQLKSNKYSGEALQKMKQCQKKTYDLKKEYDSFNQSKEYTEQKKNQNEETQTGNSTFKPNQYTIPKELFRNDIEKLKEQEKSDSAQKSDINYNWEKNEINSNPFFSRPYFASLNAMSNAGTQIIEIFATESDTCTEIHFKANDTIKAYQKPELKNKELIIRFPEIQNTTEDFSKAEEIFPINSIKNEFIRNFLIYHIMLEEEPQSVSSKRNGPKEVVCSIYHKDKPKSEIESNEVSKEDKSKPKDKEEKSEFTKERKKWKLDVIVLDPGHGGDDPGAISIHGYKEKNIAMSIALKVRDLLKEKMPGTKIIMTRDDDTFIELYRRGQIANKANGKLFISIHLNSMPKKPYHSNGFESYILRPGRNDDAVRVANKENSAIKFEKDKTHYKELTEEEIIIATVAQSAFVKLSELFARILQEEIDKTTTMANRGVNQAGFYVLVGSSMPNILFEGGFLSNEKDEKFLISEKGQNKIAQGIVNAILRYADEYENLVNGK